MTKEWDLFFLNEAKHIASRSKDPSTQTGAVIVAPDGKRIVSKGYNGFPKRMQDNPAWLTDRTEKYRRIVHCEMNAAMFAREPLDGCTLYTYPFLSCDRCFVHMVQYGITRFVGPKIPDDIASRWGDAIDWVKTEAARMNLEMVEYEFA